MIPLPPPNKITFYIIIKLPVVIYLQSAELLPSLFFSISWNKRHLAGSKGNATFKYFDNWLYVINHFLFG